MVHITEQTYRYLISKLNHIRDINNCFNRFNNLTELKNEVQVSCLYTRMKKKLLNQIEQEIKRAEKQYFNDRLY